MEGDGHEAEQDIINLLEKQGIRSSEKSQIANRKSQITVTVWGTGTPLQGVYVQRGHG